MEKILFWAVFFLAYTLQAITGFAGNIIAMPVGIATVGMSTSVAVLNICGFLACGLIAVTNLSHIAWREFGKIIAVMTVFLFVGIWLDTVLPLEVLLKIYGIVVVAVGIRGIVQKKERVLPEWLLWGTLVMAGLIQGMFVSGGAFLVIYALQKIKDKESFRATLSLVWTVLNLLYAVVAFSQGHMTDQVLDLVFVCVPLLVGATVVGAWIAKRISQEAFLEVTYILLTVIGVILII